MTPLITYDDFCKVDIRVGKVIEVLDFPEARKPSYRLRIDLGQEIGIKKSCAQLATLYTKEQLFGKFVLCVVNFSNKQVGPAISEVLTLGVPNEKGLAVLIEPDDQVPLGGRLY